MNEPLGIVAERAANRAKYARFAYVAPQDRISRDPVVQAPQVKAKDSPGKRVGLGPRRLISQKAQQVVSAFAKSFGVTVDEILSVNRNRKRARPRQAAMHFMHRQMKMSQPVIGKVLKRDHTTVLHGVRVTSYMLEKDAEFSAAYHRAAQAIRAAWAK